MTQSSGETMLLHVYSYKEGMLSKVAHDLRFRSEALRFTLTKGASAGHHELFLSLPLRELFVEGAMVDGLVKEGLLTDKDKGKIRESMLTQVLQEKRYPEASFRGELIERGGQFEVRGSLSLHGQERPIEVMLKEEGDALQASFLLYQPDFGIKPFSAMLGTLKIKPELKVEVTASKSLLTKAF